MKQRKVCYRCGQPEDSVIHHKDYGGGSYTISLEGEYRSESVEPYHGPLTHEYEPGVLREGT